MATLELAELYKRFPRTGVQALNNVTLTVQHGTHLCIVGPSGSGKSTLLKVVAGLLPIERGAVYYDGALMNSVPPHRRGAVMLFQDHLLFPFLDVAENIAFGLRMRKIGAHERRRRVAEMLRVVQLQGYERRQPHQLSGGQQQRVSLARALVTHPKLLLLDEPLASLDSHLRFQMVQLITRIQQELAITTLTVTHNQEEAFAMSTRVALMYDGAIEQIGDSHSLTRTPLSPRAAEFFGNRNRIQGVKRGPRITTAISTFRLETTSASLKVADGNVTLFVRPEGLRATTRSAPYNTLTATIERSYFSGTQWKSHIRVGDYQLEMTHAHQPPPTNTTVVAVDPAAITLFTDNIDSSNS